MTSTTLASNGFSDNKGLGGVLSLENSIKTGLGHCYLTLTLKGPHDKKTEDRSGHFAFFGNGFTQICGQILSITVKTVSNTILVAFRNVKSEKVSLPVNVRRSKIVGA